MSRLEGRVAVITGAASGLGLATVRRFVAEGARVVAADRDEDLLRALASEFGDAILPVAADITRGRDLERLRARILDVHGSVDVLFANAGIAAFAPVGEVDEDTFDRLIATNLKGTFFTVQTLLPVLRDGASVILTSSVSGFTGSPAFSVYSATKAAIRSLARTLTTDLQARRIRVNAVAPGIIETPIGGNAGLSVDELAAFYAKSTSETPAGRNGQADDIASAVLYLASDDASFVAGSELVVDGGWSQV